MRKLLAEDDEPGGDRHGVRRQRREAGSGQCVRVLERPLQDAGAEGVEDDEGDCRDEPDSAVDEELRGDVSAGEEEAGGEAECRPGGEPCPPTSQRQSGEEENAEPQSDGSRVRRKVGLLGIDDRQ